MGRVISSLNEYKIISILLFVTYEEMNNTFEAKLFII